MKPIRLSFIPKQESNVEIFKEFACPLNISKVRYDPPQKRDMAICICFFNYLNSSRILMNYLFMTEKLRMADIPFFTIESYIESPQIKDAYHIKSKSPLFRKENLYRILEKTIPEHYTKLLFMDCDLIFENKNWYDNISNNLNFYDIVKPFSIANFLDLTYSKVILQKNKHEGFAWAMTREWYTKIGFFDLAILGSGDSIFFKAITGNQIFKIPHGECLLPELEKYVTKIKQNYSPKYTTYNCNIYHLYHGRLNNRQYGSRYSVFNDVNDIREIVYIAEDGQYELKSNKYIEKIQEYFANRNDDLI